MAAINSNGSGGGVWSAVGSWAGAAVPIEGDTVTILNGDTITIDQNITVGADTATAAIDVASGGKLEVLSTVAADYTLTLKGDLKNSSGGTIEIGTVANPIPAARIFTIKLNYSAALAIGKYGFLHSGDLIIQGDPARITVTNCLLNADAAVDATILTSDVTTGWKDNDKIAIASTSRTWSEVEDGTMNGNAVGTALTIDGFAGVAGGLANAHQGTDNSQGDSCRAEIINLTRNIKITSHNAAFEGYVLLDVDSTCDIDYAEFYELGMNTADKYGFVVKTVAASTIHYCSFYNMYRGISIPQYYSDLMTFDHDIIYNTTDHGIYSDADESEVITNNIVMKAAGYGLYFARPTLDGRGNTVTSCSGIYSVYTGDYTGLNIDNLVVHSNSGYLHTYIDSSIDNLKYWRNSNYFRILNSTTVANSVFFGNGINIRNSISAVTYDTCRVYSEALYTSSYGFYYSNGADIKLIDCEIGTDGAHTVADLHCYLYSLMLLINTKLSSPTQVISFQDTTKGSKIECEDLGQVQYNDQAWYKYGRAIRDSSVKKTGSYSTRFDQFWAATDWLEYELQIPVNDGAPVVAACWLRKNASYTSANRPKIKLSGMGITETEDHMSDVTDTWEKVTVSGTPTRTGMAKLTIMTYLTNAGASAWCDFDKTGLTMPVLNTLEGSFWADGHFATILFDTGSITAAEFWKTLTADIDETGSFANLFKDNLDAKVSDVPSDVWDEILTGATHNIATSAGRRVREIGAYAIDSGTAQAGDSHSITIAASASPSDPLYNGIFNRNLIVLTDNTGVGQTRTIVDYDAVTKIVVVDRDWRISPDATTEYQITPDDTPLTVDHGVARGGTNRTITIRAYAASDDDAYICNIVTIIAGAGRGQARLVDSYDGTNKIVTICGDDWVVTPDTSSVYVMMPYGVACAACMGNEALDEIGDCVWDEDLTTHSTSNSASWFIQKIKSIVGFIRIKVL